MSGERTRAEMAEQPQVLRRLAERFEIRSRPCAPWRAGRSRGVVFVARGSSDNAAVYGAYLAELASGVRRAGRA
jgi:glucosamine--fructose-6-phosphate aminotransferase (isomerizing)